jgi:hypothetical protein
MGPSELIPQLAWEQRHQHVRSSEREGTWEMKKIIVDNLGIDVKSIMDIIHYKKIIELERRSFHVRLL